MKILMDKVFLTAGYNSTSHFINSAFHPEMFNMTAILSTLFAGIAYYFNAVFGIVLPVGIGIILLFILEFYTGLKASKKEGLKFDSELFGKGWFKMFVYMLMIGISHAMAINIPVKDIFGFTFNVYEWLHYGFYNYIIINLFLSNIENFKRLGWTEYLPLLRYLAQFVKDEPKKPKDD
jgi:peptidoglycan biosynthesis protein MviN/MurJ (putative lipid II flippase)